MSDAAPFLKQALAQANNYINTGRPNKTVEMLNVINKVQANIPEATLLMDTLYAIQTSTPLPERSHLFGQWWLGEDLSGKSIEIFCDQGMGDTIQLLRYVKLLKSRYNCDVYLNYYAFYNAFERLLGNQNYITKFIQVHEKCDFVTNIMSLPALLYNIPLDVYYPVHFKEVMEKWAIPEVVLDGWRVKFRSKPNDRLKVGVAWETNADNPLAVIKSIPMEYFESLRSDDMDFYSLLPGKSNDWIKPTEIKDLADTAKIINDMDVVVTVDTAVLHLSGACHRLTYGILAHDCDPRWEGEDQSRWYHSVWLFRQNSNLDWSPAIQGVKERLARI